MYNRINKKLIQIGHEDYIFINDLNTRFRVNIDDQSCQCQKPNCQHLQYVNMKIYHKKTTKQSRLNLLDLNQNQRSQKLRGGSN